MIRLTIMYNLPPDADEDAFLKWRLSDHQEENANEPGVIRTDFAKIERAHLSDEKPAHRFMTTADWATWESFEASFYAPETQEKLKKDMGKISDAVFLISEVLTETTNEP
jgi:hypothetical protein